VNSLACVRDEAGTETFQSHAKKERPSVVLFPLVRKEHLFAGDEALLSERGLGLPWPPLAGAAPAGWSGALPPADRGRVLLGTVWERLMAGKQWPDHQWQPPDGLPPMNQPTPADCLDAEAQAVLRRAIGDGNNASVVLAIPNQLPEESQDALLTRLPAGTRLVWSSVATAMAWGESNGERIRSDTKLAVLDAGLHGVEISVFEFRLHELAKGLFQVPIRRLNRLRAVNTGSLLSDGHAPFGGIHTDTARLENHLSEISDAIGAQSELVICGAFGGTLVSILRRRFPRFAWPACDAQAVARGSALFASRLASGWPTYLDVLPSLELFVTNRYREPEWMSIIPVNLEVAGGQDYVQMFPRIRAIRAGTGKLENWLRRSNESGLRKDTIELARVAKAEVPVDLRVAARSAGGFARLEVSPTDERSDVFGDNRRLLLNWLKMERQEAMPSGFPSGTRYGWPDTGELFGHRPAFLDFLRYGLEYCREGDVSILAALESVATKPTPVPSLDQPEHRTGVESGTIPLRSLPCFGSGNPCRFFEGGTPSQRELEVLDRMSATLLQELNRLQSSRLTFDKRRTRLLIRILGRMGSHSPPAFAKFVTADLKPRMAPNTLFAVGRVFRSSQQAKLFFETVRLKAELGHSLNTPWLRVLDYLLFQRPNILESTAREDLEAAMKLSLASLHSELEAKKFKVKFDLSVRVIARLLRTRRHYPDFVSLSSEVGSERSLAERIKTTLDDCLKVLSRATDSEGLRKDRHARLCSLTSDWLLIAAATGVLGPPPLDEEEGDEDENEPGS